MDDHDAAPEGSSHPAPAADARDLLLSHINSNWKTQAIGVAVRLGLPELLRERPREVAALAAATESDAAALRRLVHALASLDLVADDENGAWALTPSGRLLCAGVPHSLAAYAVYCGTASWRTWGRLFDCVRSGKSVRQLAGLETFAHLERDPEAARLFHRAMRDITEPVAASLAEAVDFGGPLRIVDVGGGTGELLAAILAAWPQASGIVFDQPHAGAHAAELLRGAGLASRCIVESGDFFDAVPAGADVYVLKSILHDWNDADCHAILATCARAAPMDARLVIVERMAPERYGPSARDQRIARSDLNMLAGPGGRERTFGEYGALCAAAGFRIAGQQPLIDAFSAIEARRGP